MAMAARTRNLVRTFMVELRSWMCVVYSERMSSNAVVVVVESVEEVEEESGKARFNSRQTCQICMRMDVIAD